MNDGMLSQEEIDALLKGGNSEESQDAEQTEPDQTLMLEHYLSTMEQDALGEIGNISFGSAATALSTLLNQKVDITTPKVSLVKRGDLAKEFPIPHVSVLVSFTEGFEGSNVLVIKTSDARVIADLMLGGDGTAPDEGIGEIQLSAVQEAMNQMMGSSATSMSTIFNKRIDISPPSIEIMDAKEDKGTENIPDDEILLKVSFNLKIGTLIDSNIMQLIPINFAKELVSLLLTPSMNESYEETAATSQTIEREAIPAQQDTPSNNRDQMGDVLAQSQNRTVQRTNVQPADFSNFETTNHAPNDTRNIDLLLDIPLKVSVELGRTTRTVKDILDLGPGSIIELDKLAGEPVDILINNKPIAKGEVVVIDENFGVRVTEILSQNERISKLN